MKSIRLNKEIREAILNNIATAYDKANPEPALNLNPNAVLEKAVIAHYKRQSKDIQKLIDANPKLAPTIQYTSRLGYRTPTGQWDSVIKDAESSPLGFINAFSDTRIFDCPDYLLKNPSLTKAAKDWKVVQQKAREERSIHSTWVRERLNYLDEIRQVLAGVNTTKQLLEQWEEVKKYIPTAYFNPSKINLPAINVKSLNAKLGK